MLSLRPIVEWLANTTISHNFNEAHYLFFGGFMALHLLGIALLLGTSLIANLRILNIGLRSADSGSIHRQLRPCFISGIALAFLAGTWLFVADPMKYYANPAFHIKIYLLLLALLAQLTLAHIQPSISAKSIAVLAVLFWFGTIISGRVVGLL